MCSHFFQIGAPPADQMLGSYNMITVFVSYLVAVASSYCALDIVGRLRDMRVTSRATLLWFAGGSFAMGAGIWSMHFIGMLAYSMPMSFNPYLTLLSLLVAILASGSALILLKNKVVTIYRLALGGVFLGFGIASMHYIGMEAMKDEMNICYKPGLFIISIVVALSASELALWLAIKSTKNTIQNRFQFKIVSALVMGIGICGMHYIGMEATIFTPKAINFNNYPLLIDPQILSSIVALVIFIILGTTLGCANYKEILQDRIGKLAHQAGMAEVATNVIHNVGNVLNSINISVELIYQHANSSKVSGLLQVSELIEGHKQDFGDFVTRDPRGVHLPEYLQLLAGEWQQEQEFILAEIKNLTSSVQHIKDIIIQQQSLSGLSSFEEFVHLEHVIAESLAIASAVLKTQKIDIEKNFAKIKPVLIDKRKLQQILINLIRNAFQAMSESSKPDKTLKITLTSNHKDKFYIQIADNGNGISAETLKKIFEHGFTTKKEGNGFGLHSSAINANELGGVLRAESDGKGKGAVFILELPLKTEHSSKSATIGD